jgi:hypothetical protein
MKINNDYSAKFYMRITCSDGLGIIGSVGKAAEETGKDIYIYIYIYTYIYAYMHIYIHIYIYVYIYISLPIFDWICMYVYRYICMYHMWS